jgi:hypothetical protein
VSCLHLAPSKRTLRQRYVGYFVMKGAQGAAPAKVVSVARTITAADPIEMYPLQGARLPFGPLKGATGLNFEMPERHRDRPMAQMCSHGFSETRN